MANKNMIKVMPGQADNLPERKQTGEAL